ncbi:nucleotidyltransferase [Bacteroidia bacterium]|nr:nucleotidyltransferase [Bacteroidia bacterium]
MLKYLQIYFTTFADVEIEVSMIEDIRWQQRFSNYQKALTKLTEAIELINTHILDDEVSVGTKETNLILNEIVKEGLVQRFKYTHELAWNVMKDYAEYQGNSTVGGSRDATREAYQLKLISNGEIWMDMIKSRNQTSHTYNDVIVNEIYHKILLQYYPAFLDFRNTMEDKRTSI